MQPAAELELPYLTMDEDAFAVDSFPHFARARARHPRLARWTLGYVVTDYKAMRDLFAREDRMRMLYDNIVAIMWADGTLGARICLGQYIARAQIHEGPHLIARRLLNPRSSGPLGYRPFPGTWGVRGLPIAFDPAENP